MKSCIIAALWKQCGGVCGRKTKNEMLCQMGYVLPGGGTFWITTGGRAKNAEKTGKTACVFLWTTLWKLWITICKEKLSKTLCKSMERRGGRSGFMPKH